MTPPPSGTPWWAWAIVTALVLIAWPAVQGWRESRRARHEVKNSHAINLRDDLDKKHEAVLAAVAEKFEAVLDELGDVKDAQKRHDAEIQGVRKDIRQDRDAVETVTRRLDGHTAESRREHEALVRRIERLSPQP